MTYEITIFIALYVGTRARKAPIRVKTKSLIRKMRQGAPTEWLRRKTRLYMFVLRALRAFSTEFDAHEIYCRVNLSEKRK